MPKLKKSQKQLIELLITIFIGFLAVVAWDTFLIYPIKLFVVLTHELSHAIAAIVSGGTVHSITVSENLGGSTSISDGSETVISAAGYLGSVLFGSLLFISGYNKKTANWICYSFAAIFLISAANLIDGAIGKILAVFYAVLLIISPNYFPKIVHNYFMKILGIVSCLYAVIDIKVDLLTTAYRPSDAQLLANITSIPAYVWGILWFFISIAVVIYLLRYSYKKGY